MKTTDLFSEIYQSIKRHRVRNVLTGFGVAWGVFILVLLLGAGEGLRQGVYHLFSSFAQNSVWVYAGQVSEPTAEGRIGEPVRFDDDLLATIVRRFRQVEYASPEFQHHQQIIVSRGEKASAGYLRGVGKDYFHIKLLDLYAGRVFNDMDFLQERPVCIIGYHISQQLADKDHNKDLIGTWINIAGEIMLVVGILDEGSVFTQGEQSNIYTTVNTYRQRYNSETSFGTIGLALRPGVDDKKFQEQLTAFLGHRLHFKPSDNKALYIANISEQVESFQKLFNGLELFIWFMGLGLLLSGIIGIGNMLSTAVRERTQEIGIRKALGARPTSILKMILLESVSLTLISGLIGMLIGFVIVSLGNYVLSSQQDDGQGLIRALSVDYPVIVQAILVLVIAGCFAGFVPAKNASEIVPVKALNHGA